MKAIRLFSNQKPAVAAIALGLVLAAASPWVCAQEPGAEPDLVITVTRLTETLDLVDQLAGGGKEGAGSPTAVLRGSLMGTAWIDPGRPVVIGVRFQNGVPSATALVPFKQPNPEFRSAYHAKTGPDYYVMALPRNPEMPPTAADEAALLSAGSLPQEKLVSARIALGRLVASNSDKIEQWVAGLPGAPGEVGEGRPAPPLSPEDARIMVRNGVALLRQMTALTLAFDLNQETLSMGYEVTAAPDSRLAEVLDASGRSVLLPGAPTEEQITFASRSYNLPGLLGLVGEAFGDAYRQLGIDFAGLERISRRFTGEMQAGMTIGTRRLDFGFMAVLGEDVPAAEFLEKEYIPWLLAYGRQMGAMLEGAAAPKPAEPIALTAESTVKGQRVLGFRVELPGAVFASPAGPVAAPLPIGAYEMRMTTSGRVLLAASDDARLGALIDQAGSLEPRPASGPVMTGEVDLAGYLSTVKTWAQQEGAGDLPPLPSLGRMVFQGDMGDGRAAFEMSLRLKDIRSLIAYARAAAPAEGASGAKRPQAASGEAAPKAPAALAAEPDPGAGPRPGTLKVPPPREAVPVREDAEYWTAQAYLCTTYGNDEAAIGFFRKAIALSPESSNLYFQMGISYAELGRFPSALEAIDKAIALGGEKGLYFYGRGRVLLQSGREAEGLADIRRAAEMGDLDAIGYLEGSNPKPAG